jgi:hypothetical protein
MLRSAILLTLTALALTSPAAPNPDAPRARVTRHVEDDQGHPVANAQVEAVTLPGRPTTRADAAGHFTLEWPDAKLYVRLRAASPDGTHLAIPQLHWNKPTAVNPGLTIDDLRIVLKPAREFAVTVQDSAGKPVDGAWVAANCGFALGGEATTDAAGSARLRVPADAPIQYVLASKPNAGFDYHLFWQKDEPRNDPYRLDPDFAGPLTFTLSGIKPVTVRVVDSDKHPLPGVQVYPWLIAKPRKGDDANLSGLTQYFRTTDASGQAHFDQIPIDQARSITFWARLDGYCTVDRCVYDPKTAGPTIETVMTPLLPVTGKVLDEQGQPATNATVKVAGTGYTFDSFREQTKTGPDGTFRIGVNPNMYYMFAAQLGGDDPDKPRLISTPHVQVILTQAPAPVELKLGPAIRVFGRATAGPDHAPIPKASVVAQQRDESYFKLPKDQKLPNPKDSHRAISAMLPVWQTAGDDGAYEFFLAPGDYDLYRSGAPSNGRPKPLTLTAGQTEVEYNLYSPDARPSAGPNILKGRVVRADDPKVGVPEASIEGHHVKLDPVFVRGVSAKDGAFALRRGESDLVLFAATADKKLAAITLVKSTDDTATLPLAPTASATGRLLDHDGRPAAGRRIDYGTRIGPPKGPFIDAFGGTTTTADDGTFTVTGLVPGYEYHLNPVTELDADGRPRGWSGAGTVKAERAEQLHLGDRKMPKPYTPPTPADFITTAFASKAPLDQRLDKARHTAQACYQNVLVVLAAPDRAPLRRFFDHWRDDQEYDVWNAFAEYVTVFVNVDTADAKTRAWADANHIPWPTPSPFSRDPTGSAPPADNNAMTFAVLDETGHLLATAPAGPLLAAGDAKAQRARLIEFAKKNARTLPDAQKLLDDALARAKREDKRVLLDQTGALCGWCVRLHDYLESQRHLIDKDYVTVVLDGRMPHGREILQRLRSKNEDDQGSTPWMAILDADGKTLITSDGPHGNIGYPGEPGGQSHWEQMLRSTAKRLTPDEIQSLLQPLRHPDGL